MYDNDYREDPVLVIIIVDDVFTIACVTVDNFVYIGINREVIGSLLVC